MARVLFVWELGGGMGHIARATPIIDGLLDAGHDVFVALRDLSRATQLLHRVSEVRLLQCPLWLAEPKGLPAAATYAELMFRFGFGEPVGLEGLTRAWRELFRLVNPDLLLADHAPNALLAARGQPFKRALLGNGFFSPPRVSPLPLFRTWENIAPVRIASADAHALATSNKVLAHLGAPPLARLCDLFDVDEDFLCTWPELDHYGGREHQRYWGPATERKRGIAPAWPEGSGPCVFVYIKAELQTREPIIAALKFLEVRALLYVPGLGAQKRSEHESNAMHFAVEPVRIGEAMAHADVLICTAGEGTIAAALLAGVPVLAIPMHAEQYLTALNIHRAGVGLAAQPQVPEAQLITLIGALLNEPKFRNSARAFAARHADFDTDTANAQIVARCEELLAAADTG